MIRDQAIDPVGECKGILYLYQRLAKRLGFEELFPWESEKALVADELSACQIDFDYLTREKPEGDFYQDIDYNIPADTF